MSPIQLTQQLYGHSSEHKYYGIPTVPTIVITKRYTELVFLNVYGAPEWILRNEFRQPM